MADNMFCEKCGRMLGEDDKYCPLCGMSVPERENINRVNIYEDIGENKTADRSGCVNNRFNSTFGTASSENSDVIECVAANGEVRFKSRMTAGFLQVFLGCLGVGRFYMGNVGMGIAQIAVTVVTCGVGGVIWGFCDGISILCGKK